MGAVNVNHLSSLLSREHRTQHAIINISIIVAILHIWTDVFILEEQIDFNVQINTLSIYQSAQSKPALIPQIPYISHIAWGWKLILLQILFFLSPVRWSCGLHVPCLQWRINITSYRCFREENLQPVETQVENQHVELEDNGKFKAFK